MNYRANIVIFHEIVPLSARSSKKEDAKRGTGAREMAKTDRKTGGIRGCNSWHLLFRSAANRAPPEARRRSGSEWRARRPNRVTKRRNRRATPARVGSTPFRLKKEEHATQALGTFPTYWGAFRPSPPPAAVPLAVARSEVGESDENPSRASAHITEFRFFAFTHLR